MKIIGTVAGAVLGALMLTSVASATPTESSLTFTYGGNTGRISIKNTFDSSASSSDGCIQRLRANVSYKGKVFASSPLSTRNVRSGRAETYRAQVGGILNRGGAPAVLTIQSKTECNGVSFVSNAVARYVICGRGIRKSTPLEFLADLRSKL